MSFSSVLNVSGSWEYHTFYLDAAQQLHRPFTVLGNKTPKQPQPKTATK